MTLSFRAIEIAEALIVLGGLLSKYAKRQGQVDAYRGDDGKVWIVGFESLEESA